MNLRPIFLLLGLLVVAPPSLAASPAPTPAFTPTPCAFKDVPATWPRKNRIDCGWLTVPESRGKPGSRTLKLFVAIARANVGVKPAEPMLYIHGGPGIATVDYFFPRFPESKNWPPYLASRDIVFFDQRGTGRSEPSICPGLGDDLTALKKLALPPRDTLERTRLLMAACRERMLATGIDFTAYNSTATVEDLEDLRRALGVRQWNAYGVSYGTLVGLEYLRRHPDSLRAVILDSVFPPNSPNGAEQIGTTAKAYQALQRACDRDADCAKKFPDILAELAGVTRRLDAKPLASDLGPIDGDKFTSALWTMLVRTKTAPAVPLAIARAASGDDTLVRHVVGLFGGDGSFGDFNLGQAFMVNCYEVNVPDTTATVREMQRRYPELGSAGDLPEETDVMCRALQTERAPMAFFAPVASDVPVLLYGGEFDPATPFDDALLAARHLSNSTLVYVPGASHASFATDDCTREIAYAFVADPAIKPDLACLASRPAVVFPTQGLEHFLK